MAIDSNEIHLEDWNNRFLKLIKAANEIWIISPFISHIAIDTLQHRSKHGDVRLITRYDLGNFAKGVSDLKTIKTLARQGVQIRGILGLHSKIYLFDKKTAVITSANFTSGGLINNLECGIITQAKSDISQLTTYFDTLWNYGEKDLTIKKIAEWEAKIKKNKAKIVPQNNIFADEGAKIPKASTGLRLGASKSKREAYLKFWGKSESRASRHETVKEILRWTEANYAGTFPKGRRPTSIKENETIYMTYLVTNPPGYLVFGKAYATQYVEGRDDASPQEIARKRWKTDYPHYIRVHAPVFINAKLKDCPELEPLIERHGYNVFRSTRRRAKRGESDINPHLSLRQQPGMYLTAEATVDLEKQFDIALERYGRVPEKFIDTLPKPTAWMHPGSMSRNQIEPARPSTVRSVTRNVLAALRGIGVQKFVTFYEEFKNGRRLEVIHRLEENGDRNASAQIRWGFARTLFQHHWQEAALAYVCRSKRVSTNVRDAAKRLLVKERRGS